MILRALALLLSLAAPAAAQTPMSGAEFEAYTTGKTLYFSSGDVPYGVEEYFPGRRVRWSFLDGECKDGTWYEAQDHICFEYEDDTPAQCWQFFEGPTGLRARFQGDSPGRELYETHQADEPMYCKGPRVGA